MKVKELIDILLSIDEDKEVLLRAVDIYYPQAPLATIIGVNQESATMYSKDGWYKEGGNEKFVVIE